MKKKAARILALMLTLTMVVGLTPVWAVPSAEQEPAVLGGSSITLPEDAEGTFLAFAANTVVDETPSAMWTLDETGRYAVTIYRAGDLSGETTVDLRTIDTSAVYGEDYRIDDPRYQTEVMTTEGTLLQQYANNEEAIAQGQETMNDLSAQMESSQENNADTGEDPSGEAALAEDLPDAEEDSPAEGGTDGTSDEAAASGIPVPGITAAEAELPEDAVSSEEADTEDDGKSELAKWKESRISRWGKEKIRDGLRKRKDENFRGSQGGHGLGVGLRPGQQFA